MEPLKLVALDAQDLDVVSAMTQDAVMKVGELTFFPAGKRFVIALNRFVWEKQPRLFRSQPERRASVLHFEGVKGVRTTGIARERQDDVLSLLAIRFRPDEAPAGAIDLIFAGQAAIRLDVEFIEARLADLGPAWQAASRPVHRV